jgi:16S rRNA (guanine(966)-N(2))-methyltransferase RsmD
VLDLFAGTGALGLEALSRGAARAVFVDNSPESVRLVESNIMLCRAGGRAEVVRAAVPLAIRRLSRREEKFQLIFMDPPYGKGDLEKTIPLLGEVAAPEVLVVAEHHVGEILPARWEEWIKVEERKYGDTVVSFFELDKS